MLQRVKIQYRRARMELEEFVDLFLKRYDDRSKYPDNEEELKALLRVSNKTIAALREKKASLERLAASRGTNQLGFKEKTKK